MSTTELPALHTTGTFPGLAIHNHGLRIDAVIDTLQGHAIRAVADLGCGDGALVRKIASSRLHLESYLGIDPWTSRLESAEAHEELGKDWISFEQGSMTDLERVIENPAKYRHFGAVVLLETIEHVPRSEVDLIEEGVFEYVKPKLVIVTTPDATQRLNEEQLRARGHQFEWDVQEFQEWTDSVTQQFPDYSVDITQLSGPTFIRNTQVATFVHY